MNKKSPTAWLFMSFHDFFCACYRHGGYVIIAASREKRYPPLDFKQITLSDVGALRPYLRAQYRSCDYSVLGVFMWADRFGYEYKTEDGVLFMRERSRHGGEYDYLLPTGEGSLCDRVRALREAVGAGLTMSLVPEDALGELRQEFSFTAVEEPDIADYMYKAEDLAYLAGKKYSKKRNLIHQFEKLYPDYTLEPITNENARRIAECCAHDWSDAGLSELAIYENDHTREVLEDFAAYGCTGYALHVGGEIAAFCIGEVMGDTLIVHIEKGKREYKGAFQMINCLFAKTELERCGIQYINREDDVGDEGLRRAKQSYFPEYMLKKFRLEFE